MTTRLEELAAYLVSEWTDPTNPENKLKRPAKRICSICGDQYRSSVTLLADQMSCPDCTETPTHIRLGITPEETLLRAIFGVNSKEELVALQKQQANANAVADGGWPPYPSEY